jgi:hypothetical protein
MKRIPRLKQKKIQASEESLGAKIRLHTWEIFSFNEIERRNGFMKVVTIPGYLM